MVHRENTLNPNLTTPERYVRKLRGNNEAIHSRASRVLRDQGILDVIDDIIATHGSSRSSNIEILANGSDGRYEKGPRSPIDIVILLSRKIRAETREEVERSLEQLLVQQEMFSDVQAKNLQGQDGLIYYKGQAEHTFTWPTVLIDSKTLLGRGRQLLPQARRQLFEEYRLERKRILSAETDRRKTFARVCRGTDFDQKKIGMYTVEGKERRHFDLENGRAIYDPRTGQKGFKYGPLRLVQASLGIQLAHAAQTENGLQIITDCPAHTADKLSYLHDMGALHGTSADADELSEHYGYFLWQYHRSEFAYAQNRSRIIEFDRNEVRDRVAEVVKLEQVIRGVKPEKR